MVFSSKFHTTLDNPNLPWFSVIWIYVIYAVCMIRGYIYDYIDKLMGKKHFTTRSGYPPLSDEFESFYVRRMYGILSDCWNRPISSSPATWIDVLERESNDHNQTFKLTGKTQNALNLASYNYLGFAGYDRNSSESIIDIVKKYGVGCVSSRSEIGSLDIHRHLELKMAKFLGKEDCMVFGMGFGTNATTIPALVKKGDLVISDALNHASTVVGCRSSGAAVRTFAHNDASDLERVVREAIVYGQPVHHRPWRKIMIVVEGVYSMEGEVANLQDIVKIKNKYHCYLYVDEAHSIGALGKTGRGICESTGVATSDVDVLMGTFTKAFSSVGGYIAADKHVVDYLRCRSYTQLYEPAMGPACCMQALVALKVIMGEDGTDIGKKKLESLKENSNFFRKALIDRGFEIFGDEDSPVIPMMLYHATKMPAFSRDALKRNLAIVVVGYPATPLTMSRARFCISAAHTREDLEWAVKEIDDLGDRLWMKYGKYGYLDK